jgi:hypothetical protein
MATQHGEGNRNVEKSWLAQPARPEQFASGEHISSKATISQRSKPFGEWKHFHPATGRLLDKRNEAEAEWK